MGQPEMERTTLRTFQDTPTTHRPWSPHLPHQDVHGQKEHLLLYTYGWHLTPLHRERERCSRETNSISESCPGSSCWGRVQPAQQEGAGAGKDRDQVCHWWWQRQHEKDAGNWAVKKPAGNVGSGGGIQEKEKKAKVRAFQKTSSKEAGKADGRMPRTRNEWEPAVSVK